MLDRRSAIASVKAYKSAALQIGEARDFSLLQVTGDAKAIAKVVGKLPAQVGIIQRSNERIVMRIGADQFWFVGPENDNISGTLQDVAILTPLSHSRTRLLLEGSPARIILAKSIPLDFHVSVFKPNMFAMTGIHHTPVLVHCVAENRFEIFALRTFAVSVYEWLTDAALEFADR